MPQYYFSMQLIAKKRQVKIRQRKILQNRNTLNPAGIWSIEKVKFRDLKGK